MNNPPRTNSKAQEYRYGERAGNPGQAYNSECCAMATWDKIRWPTEHQCKRKSGYGPENLYCKQHAKQVESNDKDLKDLSH